jgi:hypothetical protein
VVRREVGSVVGEVLEPQFDKPEALPYGGEEGKTLGAKGWYKDKDVLDLVRTRRVGQAVHSDGFLSFGGLMKPAYVCECGFNGMFESSNCSRCGKAIAL